MIEYVIGENPDDRILTKASKILREGGLVVLPSDTNWVVVCDPYCKKGVERFYRLKREGPLKHYSVLCDTVSRASEIASISDIAFRLIRNKIPGNYTFIFLATKKITKALQASKSDKEIGVRFPPCKLTQKLIESHGDVLLSTHVTYEMVALEEDKDIHSYQIEDVLSGKIDLILDPGDYDFAGASTIVDLSDDEGISLIREGAGAWP